ncbi:MAG: SMP-30/gluconolactonase/LRE family protein [Halioglobus sp.]
MKTPEFIGSIDVGNELGEGIIWDERDESIWWTDIQNSMLYRCHLAEEKLEQWTTPERVGCFALVADKDYLIVGFESGFAYYDPRSGYLEWLKKVGQDTPNTRLNDGRADRQGRFWAGSMVENGGSPPAGKLYCMDQQMQCSSHFSELSISNGLCWSPDSAFMYHTDTPTREIYRYNFDATTGAMSNRTLFVKTEQGCFPDGSTVDAQGYLWNAQWGASQVVRYSPHGEVDLVLKVPASQPSCVAFGGPKLDTLFVTTARENLSADDLAQQSEAGNVLIYRTDISSIPDPRFDPA